MGPSARALALSLAGSLALLACLAPDAPSASPAPEAKEGLRVGLPEGWVATPAGTGLDVGPKGRVVLQLEPSARALPSLEALLQQLTVQGVRVTQKDETGGFVGVRYALSLDGGGGEGFVGVKRVGARTVWCATTGGASGAEVAEAYALCREVAVGATAR